MGKTSTNKLPKKLYPYFWDVAPEKIDLSQREDFVVKRVLEHGDTRDILWLKHNFGLEKFKQVLNRYRDLSRKTGIFWAKMLDLEEGEVKCLQTPYRTIPYGV